MSSTLTYQPLPGGAPVTKPLTEWGLSRPVLTRAHLAGDELRFTIVEPRAFRAANPFPVGSGGLGHRIWLTVDDVVRFVGLAGRPRRLADGRTDERTYVVQGIGSLLTRVAFKQVRKAGIAPPWSLVDVENDHVWLGRKAAGGYQTNGEQVAEILAWAAACLAPDGHVFQHDATGFPEVNILLEEERGILCHQALAKMLKHSPDCVLRWDYSTLDAGLPKPTARVQSRAAMTAVTLPWQAGQIEIDERTDRDVRAVDITYEDSTAVAGDTHVVLARDTYPATLNGNPVTGNEAGVLSVTVPLQGSTSQVFTASVQTDQILAASADVALRLPWWLNNCPALRTAANVARGLTYDGSGNCPLTVLAGVSYLYHPGPEDDDLIQTTAGNLTSTQYFTNASTSVTLVGTPGAAVTAFVGRITLAAADVRRSGALGLGYRLLPGSGGVAPWMGKQLENETVSVKAQITDETGEREEELAVKLTATDATTGTYSKSVLLGDGEPVPSGLAQSYYTSVSGPNYQGRLTLTRQELDWSVGLGNVLNLTGAEAELATARLPVWRETTDLANGQVVLEFGVPEHLEIGDLRGHLQALRLRRLEHPVTIQTSGLLNGGGEANLPSQLPVGEVMAKTSSRQALVMAHPDPAGSGVLQRAAARLSDLSPTSTYLGVTTETEARFRTIALCVEGVTKYASVWMSNLRDAP